MCSTVGISDQWLLGNKWPWRKLPSNYRLGGWMNGIRTGSEDKHSNKY